MEQTSELKHEKVYDLLKEKVIGMPSGAKLPSLRDLMKEYGVSQLTIDKAKELLVNEGLIYNVAGKGAYTSTQSGLKKISELKQIILAIPDWESSFYTAIITELRKQLNEDQNLDVIKFSTNINALNMIKQTSPDAFFLLPPSAEMTLPELALLNTIPCPFVILDRAMQDVSVDTVYFDSDACGEQVAKHLIELGHKKLAVLISEPNISTIKERVMGFCRYARALNTDLTIIDCQTQSGEWSKEKAYTYLNNAIQKGGFDSTAIFVVSDPSALGALKALHDNSIKIPAQVSVMGCSGAPEAEYFYPPLTTSGYDYELLAKNALQVLKERITKSPDKPIKKSIPPKLIIRQSTGKK